MASIKATKDNLKTGDIVSYSIMDNTHTVKGEVVAIGPQKWGGDCLVKWNYTGVTGVEMISNLVIWPKL